MRFLKQLFVILSVSLLGELLNFLIPLPIPASIYGIVILFSLLCMKIVKIENVRQTGMFLIEIMPVMFIAPAVGIIDFWDDIKASPLVYVLLVIGTTVAVMLASAAVAQFFAEKKREAR
ncbi:MAG: CidA/LrgA family protein [Sphaerochaetaceae bacterium]|jgi:holin-like protein|nr:CidA/LrgA family protein [Sphaerochaetaceae bacterium]